MILEYKNYISGEFVDEICQQVLPFINEVNKETTYNRDGITVNITKTLGLEELDKKISDLFSNFS